MKRDFGSESLLNAGFRLWRALAGRLRGRVFTFAGMFARGSSARLYFAAGARFLNSKAILLQSDVHFGLLARLECYGPFDGTAKIEIGQGTSFGDFVHIGSVNRVRIGKGVLVASHVLIIDHNHGDPGTDLASEKLSDPKSRPLVSKGEIVIDDHVWIGEGAVVLGGSHIGEGAIVAAHAVVKGKVEPRSVYLGVKTP